MAGPDYLQALLGDTDYDPRAWTNAIIEESPNIARAAYETVDPYLRSHMPGKLSDYPDYVADNIGTMTDFAWETAFPNYLEQTRRPKDPKEVRAARDLKTAGAAVLDSSILGLDFMSVKMLADMYKNGKISGAALKKALAPAMGAFGGIALKAVPGIGALSALFSSSPAGAGSTRYPPGTSPRKIQFDNKARKLAEELHRRPRRSPILYDLPSE